MIVNYCLSIFPIEKKNTLQRTTLVFGVFTDTTKVKENLRISGVRTRRCEILLEDLKGWSNVGNRYTLFYLNYQLK